MIKNFFNIKLSEMWKLTIKGTTLLIFSVLIGVIRTNIPIYEKFTYSLLMVGIDIILLGFIFISIFYLSNCYVKLRKLKY